MPVPTDLIADTDCLTCLGISLEDALLITLLGRIAGNIAPVTETFYRISDLTDVRIISVTDNRIYQ